MNLSYLLPDQVLIYSTRGVRLFSPAIPVRLTDNVVPFRHFIWPETLRWWFQEMAAHNLKETVEEVLPLWYLVFRFFPSILCSRNLRTGLPVPASSDKMLRKSLETPSDVIIYDLEDSVPPARADKDAARNRLQKFLSVSSRQRQAPLCGH